MLNFFKSMLNDGKGNISSTRFMVVITGFVVLIRYLSYNIVELCSTRQSFDFSQTDLIILTIILTGKIAQGLLIEKR